MKRKSNFFFIGIILIVGLLNVARSFAQGSQAEENRPDPGFSAPSSSSRIETPVGGLSRRDPFSLPEYILIKIRQKNSEKSVSTDTIDENSPPIVRWPIATYQLVGIIWDVKKPKAMFIDRMKNVHIVKVNDFIGNLRGVITKIQSGAVVVKEGQIPQVIKLNK